VKKLKVAYSEESMFGRLRYHWTKSSPETAIDAEKAVLDRSGCVWLNISTEEPFQLF
jgi:hypothetical protein